MLEFEAVQALRRAGGPGRVHVPGPAGATDRLPGPQRCREDHRDAGRVRAGRAGRGHGPLAGRADRRGRPGPLRVHARGTRPVPADAGAGAAALPRPAVRAPSLEVGRTVDAWLERLGVADGRRPAWTSCPTATSSGCSWSRPWSTSRTCSCWMSPSPAWTPSRWPPWRTARGAGRPGVTVLFSSHQLDLVEDLCEDVVIIDHGRVVLAGDLDAICEPRSRSGSSTSATAARHPNGRRCARSRCSRPRTGGSAGVPRDTEIPAVLAVAPGHDEIVSFSLPAADPVGPVPPGGRGMTACARAGTSRDARCASAPGLEGSGSAWC